jgi:hypothetical protein
MFERAGGRVVDALIEGLYARASSAICRGSVVGALESSVARQMIVCCGLP